MFYFWVLVDSIVDADDSVVGTNGLNTRQQISGARSPAAVPLAHERTVMKVLPMHMNGTDESSSANILPGQIITADDFAVNASSAAVSTVTRETVCYEPDMFTTSSASKRRHSSFVRNEINMQEKSLKDFDCMSETALYKAMRPLVVCMKVVGLLFERNYGKWSLEKRHLENLSRSYCFFVCLITGMFFVKSLASYCHYDSYGPILFFKVQVTMWTYEAMAKSIVCYSACKRKWKLHDFFVKLSHESKETLPKYARTIWKTSVCSVAFTCIFAVGNAGFLVISYLTPYKAIHSILDTTIMPAEPHWDSAPFMRAFLIFLSFVDSLVSLLPLALFGTFCYVFYREFMQVKERLSRALRDDGSFMDDLEEIRIRHQRLCKLVDHADEIFTWYIAHTYLTNVPMFCVLLYNTIYSDMHHLQLAIYMFWLTVVTVHCCSVSVAATLVNHAVST